MVLEFEPVLASLEKDQQRPPEAWVVDRVMCPALVIVPLGKLHRSREPPEARTDNPLLKIILLESPGRVVMCWDQLDGIQLLLFNSLVPNLG